MIKIGYLQAAGAPSIVIYHDAKEKVNPYRVYLEWRECTPCGVKKRKKLINKYADLCSCGCELLDYSRKYNRE